jgi:membrane protease YdiL (CAAX protease family)
MEVFMYSTKRGNLFVFLIMVSFITISILLGVLYYYTGTDIPLTLNLIISQWGMIFVPIALYFLITKSNIKETCLFRKINGVNLLLCFCLITFLSPLLSLLNLISQLFVENQIAEAVIDIVNYPLWISLLLIAVTPAVFEEITMRGILINNYRNKTVLTTSLMSGLMFGIFHLNINQFVYAFVMGIVFSIVVHITNSIFASMFMHFIVNASSVVIQKLALIFSNYMLKTNPDYIDTLAATTYTRQELLMYIGVFGLITLVTLPIAILFIYLLMRYNNKVNIFKDKLTTKEVLGLSDSPTEIITKERIVGPFFIASVSLFLIFVILTEFLLV